MTVLRIVLAGVLAALPAGAEPLGPSVSGDARMGIVWNPQPEWAGQRENGLRMTARARLKFRFTGQTDGGLRFGGEFTLDPDRQRPRPRSIFIDG